MILNLSHIHKEFVEDVVIKDATFHLEDREKAALVGNNGAGKSTLFKIIAGIYQADSGEVSISRDKTLGYLAQHTDLQSDATVFDEVLSIRQHVFDLETGMRALEKEMEHASAGVLNDLMNRHARLQEEFDKENGYAIKSEVTGVLKGLGFEEREFTLPVRSLSGGEKTRVALCKLLLIKPDLLLLDEPTNHLDIHATTWLETYLLNYPGAVFIISHDRYFMDRIVTKVVDIVKGETFTYTGNYSDFTVKKKAVWEARIREYEKQQREIHRQEEIIERFKRYNTEAYYVKAKSREKLLSHMERLEKPTEENDSMQLRLTPNVTPGNDILSIRELKKGFGDRVLFDKASFEIKRGERIMIIGDNGTGKTTLLKMINGLDTPDAGAIVYGTNVYLGYYDQEHQVLHNEKTIFDEIQDEYPTMNNTQIRNFLAAFLFTGDDVYKLIGDLSGGEKGRVSLAKLMLSDANVLILDEPTNHLDMTSKEILENALNAYEGTIICVSHDRYFINETATRILELYHNSFLNYIGNYDYYMEKKDLFHEQHDGAAKAAVETVAAGAVDWKKQKEEQARKRKAENDLKKVEDLIQSLEEKIASLDAQLEDPDIATNSAKLNELLAARQETTEKLDEQYTIWETMV